MRHWNVTPEEIGKHYPCQDHAAPGRRAAAPGHRRRRRPRDDVPLALPDHRRAVQLRLDRQRRPPQPGHPHPRRRPARSTASRCSASSGSSSTTTASSPWSPRHVRSVCSGASTRRTSRRSARGQPDRGRLHGRRARAPQRLRRRALAWGDVVMVRKQLRTLKAYAEASARGRDRRGRQDQPRRSASHAQTTSPCQACCVAGGTARSAAPARRAASRSSRRAAPARCRRARPVRRGSAARSASTASTSRPSPRGPISKKTVSSQAAPRTGQFQSHIQRPAVRGRAAGCRRGRRCARACRRRSTSAKRAASAAASSRCGRSGQVGVRHVVPVAPASSANSVGERVERPARRAPG